MVTCGEGFDEDEPIMIMRIGLFVEEESIQIFGG